MKKINKLNKLNKKIEKMLSKKIETTYILTITLSTLAIIFGLQALYLKIVNGREYYFEDINGYRGHSKECVKEKGDLYCNEKIQVKWYYKK